MDLSVCILTWNARELLEKALESVLAERDALELEVLVVDNASSDGTSEYVRSNFPQVQLISNRSNRGFAAGNNQALLAASGRYLLLLNPDTVVHPGAFKALLEYMDAHPEAGIAGPKLLNADGSLQYSCRRFPNPVAAAFRNTPLGKLAPDFQPVREYLMQDFSHDEPRAVDWVSGAALLLRRELLCSVGLLSEDYFMYLEDVDYCLRAHKAGWEVHYVPQAVITHLIGGSSSKQPVPMVIEFHKSMYRFYATHQSPGLLAFTRPLAACGISARATVVLAKLLFDLAKDKLRGT